MQFRFDTFLSQVEKYRTDEKKRRTFKYSAWFSLSVLLSQISMYFMYHLAGRPKGSDFIILTFLCTGGVLISNHVIAVHYHRYARQSVAASLIAAALLLFVADRFSPLSLRVMEYFGFGGETKTNIVLSEDGVGIIEKLRLPNKCVPATRDKLCDVDLLSKL